MLLLNYYPETNSNIFRYVTVFFLSTTGVNHDLPTNILFKILVQINAKCAFACGILLEELFPDPLRE